MGADLDRELGHGTRFHQCRADRLPHEIVHDRLLAKAHFRLRRVHVDVDFAARQVEEEQYDRVNRGRQNISVSRDDGVLDETVADQASVDEDVD